MSFLDKIRDYAKNSIVDEIIILAILVASIETIAQNTLKNSEYGTFVFIIGLSFYVIVGYFLHYAYHNVPLGRLNIIWSCFSIIIAMTVGYFMYHEPFNRYSVLSILFAFAGIFFANLSAKN